MTIPGAVRIKTGYLVKRVALLLAQHSMTAPWYGWHLASLQSVLLW